MSQPNATHATSAADAPDTPLLQVRDLNMVFPVRDGLRVKHLHALKPSRFEQKFQHGAG